ncbi:PTS sugar transporter subunit IIA [Mobilicoccus pelagius]|uniref:Ascorbate-specific PTS system EIIA component n=1 Tax=Mobilicoccus pelagius NBRC 104925 TaxID=1089455 RepID=H5UT50_9MICO|nr:PTS sugar transporter subunit IIA [Mobilicoccus pelagius]GAB48908.1 putative phosphotransferase system enzyme IIAB component [Mobilicoccus pelagius NBRC 104925]
MTSLVDLVDPGSVRVDVDAHDRDDAIRAAGDLLVRAGVAGDSYTRAMIANVEEHGPYIVVAPGFAFAHSRPDDSVTRTGMSLVRLAHPGAFGHETNDPVTLVLALAAVDADAHQDALATLARLLGDPARRRRLDEARTPEELCAALGDDPASATGAPATSGAPVVASDGAAGGADRAPTTPAAVSAATPSTATSAATSTPTEGDDEETVPSKGFILTVCGNGLGTSLFLKNTLEQVLDAWGWGPFVRVEASDTISARGRAGEADVLLTSGAIAEALGDVGVPVEVVDDFTSRAQVDAALRRVYAV